MTPKDKVIVALLGVGWFVTSAATAILDGWGHGLLVFGLGAYGIALALAFSDD